MKKLVKGPKGGWMIKNGEKGMKKLNTGIINGENTGYD
jgi:hypothetical protein